MYAKVEQRRKLGMLGRENVLKNFLSDRYLREHEQMLWIGKYRSGTHRARTSRPSSWNSSGVWLNKGKLGFGAQLISPLATPRLPPESWVSLSDALNSRPASSASSLGGWLKESKPKLSRSGHANDSMSSTEAGDSNKMVMRPKTTANLMV
jgi:hypothetical protein